VKNLVFVMQFSHFGTFTGAVQHHFAVIQCQ